MTSLRKDLVGELKFDTGTKISWELCVSRILEIKVVSPKKKVCHSR